MLVAVLAALLLGTVGLAVARTAGRDGEPPQRVCNGRAELCARPLDQVAFAGSHNSMSVAGQPGWYLPEQGSSLRSQLAAGVRALLLDVYPGYQGDRTVRTDLREAVTARAARADATPAGRAVLAKLGVSVGAVPPADADIRPYLCHAYCELGASDLVDELRGVAGFVAKHPDDVLFLVLQDYVPAAETQLAFEAAGLLQHVWRLETDQPLPTLGLMAESGRTVVVLSENHGGEVGWMPGAYDVLEETPYEFPSAAAFSCVPNRGGTGRPLFLVNHWREYRGRPSAAEAGTVNRRAVLERRLADCLRERGRAPGILAVDFAETGDVVAVVESLNRRAQR